MKPGTQPAVLKPSIAELPADEKVVFLSRLPPADGQTGRVVPAFGSVRTPLNFAAARPAAKVQLYSREKAVKVPGGQPVVVLEGSPPQGSDAWALLLDGRNLLQGHAADYAKNGCELLPLIEPADHVLPEREPPKRPTAVVEGFSPEPKRQQVARADEPEQPANQPEQPTDVPGGSSSQTAPKEQEPAGHMEVSI